MKPFFKYCLLFLVWVIFSTTSLCAENPICIHRRVGHTSVIQKEACKERVQFLYDLYSTVSANAVSCDTKSKNFKSMIRKLVDSKEYKSILQAKQKKTYPHHTLFYPDPVSYYIFTLERIVI